MEEYRLSEDVISLFRSRGKHGSRGDKVKLVAKHGNTWIVETRNGNRFPVNKKKIKPT